MEKITLKQTRQWIFNALFRLMEEESYSDITIVGIVSEAHIGRRTFYRYFSSKDDVLMQYCNLIFMEFAERILEKGNLTLYTGCLSCFEFCERHIRFLILLQKSNMLHFVGERLPAFVGKVAVDVSHITLVQAEKMMDQQGIEYYAHYFTFGGIWSIITEWIKKENRETPNEMANYLVDIMERNF